MMLRVAIVSFILLLGSVATKASTFNTQAFNSCLRERQRDGSVLTKNDTRFCRTYVRENPDTRAKNKILNADRMASLNVALDYFKGLDTWKNGFGDLETSVLERVASCYKYSNDLRKKWESTFGKRNDHLAHLLEVKNGVWQDEEGFATIESFRPGMDADELEAAEILLQRRIPDEIGETFGRYRTFVDYKDGSTYKRIHIDSQASCASKTGDLLVLDLDLASLKSNLKTRSSNSLNFRIKVQPRRQYLTNKKGNGSTRLPVVTRVVGLVLHFRQPDEDVSSHVLNAFSADHPQENSHNMDIRNALLGFDYATSVRASGSRTRRSAEPSGWRRILPTRPPVTDAPRNEHCARASHHLSREHYNKLGIVHPEHGHSIFDIGECLGNCPPPGPFTNLHATTHALVVATDMSRRSDLTICCVPNTYVDLTVTTFENHLRQRKFPNFVADSCSCR